MAKVLEVEATQGFSMEIKGNWYKFGFSIKLGLDPEDDIEEIKRKAWNTCTVEVQKQVEETIAEVNAGK